MRKSKDKKQIKENLGPLDIIEDKKIKAISRNYMYDFFEKLLFIFFLVLVLTRFIFGFKVIQNDDMYPKMIPTDLTMFYRLDKDYNQKDVVVYKKNSKTYIGRIVAKEGDKVDIKENGIYINGSLQSESDIFFETGIYSNGIKFPLELKKGEFFILGDLRLSAEDSRILGPIEKEDIEGKVFLLIRKTQF